MERVSLEEFLNDEPNGLWDSIAALSFDRSIIARFDGAGVSYALAYPFAEKPDFDRVPFRRLGGRFAAGIGTYRSSDVIFGVQLTRSGAPTIIHERRAPENARAYFHTYSMNGRSRWAEPVYELRFRSGQALNAPLS